MSEENQLMPMGKICLFVQFNSYEITVFCEVKK